jgi:hypothetical protein
MNRKQEKVIPMIGNKCSENVTGLKYFIVKLTTCNCVPGEIRRLNWGMLATIWCILGNAGYHLVQIGECWPPFGADWGMLATIWCRISYLAISCLKHQYWNV